MATLSPAPPGGLKFGGPVPTGVKVLGGAEGAVGNKRAAEGGAEGEPAAKK